MLFMLSSSDEATLAISQDLMLTDVQWDLCKELTTLCLQFQPIQAMYKHKIWHEDTSDHSPQHDEAHFATLKMRSKHKQTKCATLEV